AAPPRPGARHLFVPFAVHSFFAVRFSLFAFRCSLSLRRQPLPALGDAGDAEPAGAGGAEDDGQGVAALAGDLAALGGDGVDDALDAQGQGALLVALLAGGGHEREPALAGELAVDEVDDAPGPGRVVGPPAEGEPAGGVE